MTGAGAVPDGDGVIRVGLVGAGTISSQYLQTFAGLDLVEVVAVADLDLDRARSAVVDVPGALACAVDDLLADDRVDVVVNLTVPAAHAAVTGAAVAAGKHVWSEKPLAMTMGEGQQLVDAAAAAGVRLGCAPDTVLGTGIQTARRFVDEGLLGRPIAATAMMQSAGPEPWHPQPDFYYLPGGGPVMDMAPYYLSTLVHLLGPVVRAVGTSSRSRDVRVIGSGPRAGERIGVEVDTHVAGVLTHASGAVTTVVFSFDTVATQAPCIEVHGTEASLVVPDPNWFEGTPLAWRQDGDEWEPLEPSAGYRDGDRGVGVVDLVRTAPGTPRAGADLALHVLDVMEVLLTSGSVGPIDLTTGCERPAPLPLVVAR